MSKIYIRFIRQGLVKTETPEGFERMSPQEKIDWGSKYICGLSDEEIIDAMADFDDTSTQGYFDEPPYASAIEKGEGDNIGEVIVQTKEWELFAGGEGQEIVIDPTAKVKP